MTINHIVAATIIALLVATGASAQSIPPDVADDGLPMAASPHYVDDNAVYCGSDGRCSTPLGRAERRLGSTVIYGDIKSGQTVTPPITLGDLRGPIIGPAPIINSSGITCQDESGVTWPARGTTCYMGDRPK